MTREPVDRAPSSHTPLGAFGGAYTKREEPLSPHTDRINPPSTRRLCPVM
jgi:hypothetical protein